MRIWEQNDEPMICGSPRQKSNIILLRIYQVWSAVVQNFRWGWGSYAVYRYSCTCAVRMSPALNGSSPLQCFKYGNVVKIRNRNNVQFLPGTVTYAFTVPKLSPNLVWHDSQSGQLSQVPCLSLSTQMHIDGFLSLVKSLSKHSLSQCILPLCKDVEHKEALHHDYLPYFLLSNKRIFDHAWLYSCADFVA